MPKGITTDGLWRGREPIDEWLRRQESRPCACGCGEMVIPNRSHRNNGIPSFILGHHVRVQKGNYKGVDKWVIAEQGKHLCQCGCGSQIVILASHHASGIPRYLSGHHRPPRLGTGADHPRFVKDRGLVRSRGGHYFTPATMKEIRERCKGRCVWCFSRKAPRYDHIVAISAGGGADASNGQILCHGCHTLKTRLDRALTESPERIDEFLRSVVAFHDYAQREVILHANNRNPT
jgi:5-methylcytosine-specific restriction endonuclease McrA